MFNKERITLRGPTTLEAKGEMKQGAENKQNGWQTCGAKDWSVLSSPPCKANDYFPDR